MGETSIQITLDGAAGGHELDDLARVFGERSVPVFFEREELRFGSPIDIPWEVVIAAPPAWLALRFATGAAEKAGMDAWDAFRAGCWRGLRELIAEVAEARGRGKSTAIVVGEEAGPKVTLTSTLPDEALEALGSLDWAAMDHGRLTWNQDEEHWTLQRADASSGGPAPLRSPS